MREAARQQGPALFPAGVVCDRFRIDGVLGVGGTGTVFRALDLEREEVVALKAIPHDATLRQRARREASVAGKLRHPNVVRLRSVHEDGQYVYIASDIVEGMDLAGALRQGQLGDVALLRVASLVCAGLAHAHEHGVVHRDVKPANVLLGRDGSVRVLDFGIACLDEPDATVDDRMLGTLSYMAPETCQGARPTPATDVWAVGVMVYEALTGANPFRARTPDELRERHRHPPRSLGGSAPGSPARAGRRLRPGAQPAPAPPPERRRALPRALGGRRRARASRGACAGQRRPARAPRRPARTLPSLPRLPALRRPSIELDLTGWASAIARCGVAAPSEAVVRALRLASGSACCAIAIAAVLGAFPFWPPGLVLPLACAGAALALASPWLAAAFALAVCIPRSGRRLGRARLVRGAGGRRLARWPAFGPAGEHCCPPPRRCSHRCCCGRSTCLRPAVCAACRGARWPERQDRSRSRSGQRCPSPAGWPGARMRQRSAGAHSAGSVRHCWRRPAPGRLRRPYCRTP